MSTVPGDGPRQPGGVPGGPGPQPSQPPDTVIVHWPSAWAIVYFDCSPECEVYSQRVPPINMQWLGAGGGLCVHIASQ
jgi:hypothetical protein